MSTTQSGPNQPAVKVQITPLFPTWMYICDSGPIQLNGKLEELAHTLMKDERNAVQRTNVGGWHYAFDLFERPEPVVATFRDCMQQHVQAFLKTLHPGAQPTNDSFRLRGWLNVNRAGDKNNLHCHPGCFLSATYYVNVPPDMKGGQLVFRDPRGPAVAMYETPRISLPWVGSGMGEYYSPKTGQLIMFPSWLEHRVEPFEGPGERISIAFNASIS
jgi:uncharacterized protein (TIGR02466 family)